MVPWARPRHTWGIWWCIHVSSSYKEFIRIFIWLTYSYVYIMWVHTLYLQNCNMHFVLTSPLESKMLWWYLCCWSVLPSLCSCCIFPTQKSTVYSICVQLGLMLLYTAKKHGYLAPVVPKGFILMLFEGKKQCLHSTCSLEESNQLWKCIKSHGRLVLPGQRAPFIVHEEAHSHEVLKYFNWQKDPTRQFRNNLAVIKMTASPHDAVQSLRKSDHREFSAGSGQWS